MNNTNILVIIDNALDAIKTNKWLSSYGYHSNIVYPYLKESYEHLNDFKPDIILMDILAKGNGGKKVLKLIPDCENIPILYLTSSFDEEIISHAELKDCSLMISTSHLPDPNYIIEKAQYQKKMGTILEESENRYHLLFENANDPIAVINYSGQFLMANKSAANFFNRKPEYLINKTLEDIFPPEYAEQHLLDIQKVIDSGTAYVKESKTVIMGEERWFSMNIQPIPKVNGLSTVQLMARDITEQKNAEKILREREKFLSNTLNDMHTFVAVLKPTGDILFVNNTPLKLIDKELEEVVGKRFYDLEWWTHREDVQETIKRYVQLCAFGETIKDEMEILTNEGLIWIDFRMHPVYDEQGRVKYLVPEGINITDKRKTEKELEYEKSQTKILIENAPFGMVLIDKEGDYKYINPEFEKLFGYSLKDIPNGREWFKKAFPDPELRAKAISTWINDFKNALPGENRPRTFTVTTKDGSEKIIHFIPVLMENGNYIMTVNDVTQSKTVERMVQEREERFRTVAQSAVDVIIITDIMGNVIFSNQSLQRIFGYTEEEILGKPVNILLTHSYRDDFQRKQYHYKLTGTHLLSGKVFDSYGLRKDGSEFPLEISITTWEVGGKKYTTLIIRDNTERKLVEYQLKTSEEKFRNIAESIDEVFWIIDSTMSQILYISPSYQKIWGRSRESLFDNPRSWIKSIHPEDHKEAVEAIFRTPTEINTDSKEGIEYRIIRPDGDIRWINAHSHPLLNEKNEIHRIIGVAQDITLQKNAEEKYRNLSENINIGVYRSTSEPYGRFIEVNQNLVAMFGYDSQEEIKNIKISDLYLDPAERQEFNQKMYQYGYAKNERLRLKKKDGTPFIGLVSAVAVKDCKGEIRYYDGVIEKLGITRKVGQNPY